MSQEAVAAKLQTMGVDIIREITSQMGLGQYHAKVSMLLVLAEIYGTLIQDFFAE